jgi:hypothetical protein
LDLDHFCHSLQKNSVLLIGVVTEKIIYYITWKILFSHLWLFPPSPSQYSDFSLVKKFERIQTFDSRKKLENWEGRGRRVMGVGEEKISTKVNWFSDHRRKFWPLKQFFSSSDSCKMKLNQVLEQFTCHLICTFHSLKSVNIPCNQ